MRTTRCRPLGGFTLIELLVVLAAVALLLSIAAPRFFTQVDRSREAVLKHNLRGMRVAIDQFRADTGRYPKDLPELVAQRYLREVPIDPVTDRADSWIAVTGGGQAEGVIDVRSGAPGQGSEGTAYATW